MMIAHDAAQVIAPARADHPTSVQTSSSVAPTTSRSTRISTPPRATYNPSPRPWQQTESLAAATNRRLCSLQNFPGAREVSHFSSRRVPRLLVGRESDRPDEFEMVVQNPHDVGFEAVTSRRSAEVDTKFLLDIL